MHKLNFFLLFCCFGTVNKHEKVMIKYRFQQLNIFLIYMSTECSPKTFKTGNIYFHT